MADKQVADEVEPRFYQILFFTSKETIDRLYAACTVNIETGEIKDNVTGLTVPDFKNIHWYDAPKYKQLKM